ncbi:MAG: type II and III secretion system protein [Terriglobales bacterium]
MHWLRAGIFLLLTGVCLAADAAPPPAQPACPATSNTSPSAPACSLTDATPAAVILAPTVPSAKEEKSAKHAFRAGLKFEKAQDFENAFQAFKEAARLSPINVEYVAAREMTREHLAGVYLDRGNTDLLDGRTADGVKEFRAALELDPQNEFVQERLQASLGAAPQVQGGPVQVVAKSDSLATDPVAAMAGLHDVHYRGDARGLISAIASSYGLTAVFDDSFNDRRVRLDLDQADFATAIDAACQVAKCFVIPIEPTVLFAALDNAENHRVFDHMGMRSFYIPGVASSTDLNEVVNTLRTIFEFKFVSMNVAASTITVRGPLATLEAATRFMSQINAPQPELLLDVQVFEVSHSLATNVGLHVPNQFNLYNIPTSALAGLGGQSIQSLINQLVSSGGTNQAANAAISALLSELQSTFSQPLATFGGGLTFMGLSLDQLAAQLSLNESSVSNVQHITLRASQGKDATLKIGSRYPVLGGSYSGGGSIGALAGISASQSQAYTAPYPQVNYEDVGLTLKAKPTIHRNSDVGLEVSLQFRSLGTATVNSVPVINNREFTGGILLKNGEPALVAGMVTSSDQRSLSGLPTFAQIPGFGLLTSQHSHQEDDDELVILITPHIVLDSAQNDPQPIWLGH